MLLAGNTPETDGRFEVVQCISPSSSHTSPCSTFDDVTGQRDGNDSSCRGAQSFRVASGWVRTLALQFCFRLIDEHTSTAVVMAVRNGEAILPLARTRMRAPMHSSLAHGHACIVCRSSFTCVHLGCIPPTLVFKPPTALSLSLCRLPTCSSSQLRVRHDGRLVGRARPCHWRPPCGSCQVSVGDEVYWGEDPRRWLQVWSVRISLVICRDACVCARVCVFAAPARCSRKDKTTAANSCILFVFMCFTRHRFAASPISAFIIFTPFLALLMNAHNAKVLCCERAHVRKSFRVVVQRGPRCKHYGA